MITTNDKTIAVRAIEEDDLNIIQLWRNDKYKKIFS